ncbi:hypothetical protein INR49_007740 [Caranx melampygus]|nr:hypothetical protein INR49_007740 [Caranx melampygus]
MMSSSSFPVFLLFLLGCCLSLSLASVEPPTNVTLRCHNLQNILEWDYGILPPGVKFKVKIQPYDGVFHGSQIVWVDPPELRADISFLRDSTNYYFVDVTAVVGQNESETAPPDGLTFSYFQGSLTDMTCSLDLPPVNATMQPDGHILLSFTHPWLWHHQKIDGNRNPKRQKKSNDAKKVKELPEFTYEVLVGTGQSITNARQGPLGPAQETCYVATVEPSSPTPLLLPDSEFISTDITTDQPEFRAPIGLGRNMEEVVEDMPLNDDGHAYMEGSNMEEDETILSSRDTSSGYEKREDIPVVVDLGNDELAEGYRIRNL